jgi:hypothetical protein
MARVVMITAPCGIDVVRAVDRRRTDSEPILAPHPGGRTARKPDNVEKIRAHAR